MSKTLVLIVVDNGGIVDDVYIKTPTAEYDYFVVDHDLREIGEEQEELPLEFAEVWPTIAKDVREYNKSLED